MSNKFNDGGGGGGGSLIDGTANARLASLSLGNTVPAGPLRTDGANLVASGLIQIPEVDGLVAALASSGAGVNLTSAGGPGTVSIVADGSGPDISVKGLTPGTGVSFTVTGSDNITISAPGGAPIVAGSGIAINTVGGDRVVSTVLEEAPGGYPNVFDATNQHIRGILGGVGLMVVEQSDYIQLSPILQAGTNIGIAAGVGNALVISNTAPTSLYLEPLPPWVVDATVNPPADTFYYRLVPDRTLVVYTLSMVKTSGGAETGRGAIYSGYQYGVGGALLGQTALTTSPTGAGDYNLAFDTPVTLTVNQTYTVAYAHSGTLSVFAGKVGLADLHFAYADSVSYANAGFPAIKPAGNSSSNTRRFYMRLIGM